MRRNDPRLHSEESTANPRQSPRDCEHDRLEQGGIETGETQPWLVITNGDQHIAETPPDHPAHEDPGQDDHHGGEPEEAALHLRRTHHLTEQLGHIRLKTVGAIDQLLLAIEEVEEHQQCCLGQNREIDPLNPVAKYKIAEHGRQKRRDQPDRN